MKRFLGCLGAVALICSVIWGLSSSGPPSEANAAGGPGRYDVLAIRAQAPGSIICPSGLACVAASSVSGKPYFFDTTGSGWPAEEAQAAWRRSSAPGSPSNGSFYFNTSTNLFQFYSGGWFSPVSQASFDALEKPFVRTCTLTSAAAIAPVNCLSDADVPSGKKPYLIAWRAQVDGGTAWATTATCWIQDTGGTSNIFITMAVAALTANAFVGDHSASVTKQAPYSKNMGGTADLGLEIACDTNGTGSPLVVTVSGVIKS